MNGKPLRHGIVGIGSGAWALVETDQGATGSLVASQAAAPDAVLPAGHPQGYEDSFDAFVADVSRRVRGEDVAGLPTFADGARAARITDAVVRWSRTPTWVEVLA